MPKKFQTKNAKSAAAKELKMAREAEKELEQAKAAEDALWQDDDKLIKRKQQRKEDQAKKHELHLQKKAETKRALEQEVAGLLKSSSSTKPKQTSSIKVTQAQIDSWKKEEKNVNVIKTKEVDLLLENVNRLEIDGKEARSVDEAIEILTTDKVALIDKHPEKRRKAAYSAFEHQRLNELKLENPTLRLSQLKQIVFSEWQKSPENPLNYNKT